ncbi:MAG: polysaccharide deacetylase family protein [Candidatus Omnitrophica bacterium]|nr:polysaccharide deacetylase family protein [Candidatus Omnitrophota bacterium]
MRQIRNIVIIICVIAIMLALAAFLWLPSRYVVPILMFHQVTYTEHPQPNWVSPENFQWQMAYLKDHGYNVIRLGELVEGTLAGRAFPRKTVVITFDDGYENNYSNAFKVLKQYGFPATIFIGTDRVGTKERLTWDQMKEMIASGIDIGSHTQSEAYLPDIPVEQQQQEIQTSKNIIEQNLGVNVEHFAYPIGGFSEGIKEIVKQAGYQSACTTNRGYGRLNKDVFELKRVRFSDKDDRKDYLWIKLSGYYNLFRETKDPY